MKIAGYQVTEAEMQQITTPLVIADPEGEQFWPGRSQHLYDWVAGPKELIAYAAAEEADFAAGRRPTGSPPSASSMDLLGTSDFCRNSHVLAAHSIQDRCD